MAFDSNNIFICLYNSIINKQEQEHLLYLFAELAEQNNLELRYDICQIWMSDAYLQGMGAQYKSKAGLLGFTDVQTANEYYHEFYLYLLEQDKCIAQLPELKKAILREIIWREDGTSLGLHFSRQFEPIASPAPKPSQPFNFVESLLSDPVYYDYNPDFFDTDVEKMKKFKILGKIIHLSTFKDIKNITKKNGMQKIYDFLSDILKELKEIQQLYINDYKPSDESLVFLMKAFDLSIPHNVMTYLINVCKKIDDEKKLSKLLDALIYDLTKSDDKNENLNAIVASKAIYQERDVKLLSAEGSVIVCELGIKSLTELHSFLKNNDGDLNGFSQKHDLIASFSMLASVLSKISANFISSNFHVYDDLSLRLLEVYIKFRSNLGQTIQDTLKFQYKFLYAGGTILGDLDHLQKEECKLLTMRVNLYRTLAQAPRGKIDLKEHTLFIKRQLLRLSHSRDASESAIDDVFHEMLRDYHQSLSSAMQQLPACFKALLSHNMDNMANMEEAKNIKLYGIPPGCHFDLVSGNDVLIKSPLKEGFFELLKQELLISEKLIQFNKPPILTVYFLINRLLDKEQSSALVDEYNVIIESLATWTENYCKKKTPKKEFVLQFTKRFKGQFKQQSFAYHLYKTMKILQGSISNHLELLVREKMSSGTVGVKLYETMDKLIVIAQKHCLGNDKEIVGALNTVQEKLNNMAEQRGFAINWLDPEDINAQLRASLRA